VDFSFSEEGEQVAQATRKYVEKELIPNAHRWDQGEVVNREFLGKMGALGLLSLRLPEDHGGLGMSFVDCGRIAYEIGRGDVGLSLMVVNAIMFGELSPLMHPAVRDHWAPRIATGSPFGFTLTEPGAGSDAANIRTTARRDGEYFVINGEKSTSTFCGIADVALVFARTGGPGAKGISCFMVPWNSPGIEVKVYRNAGERVTQRGSVFYTDLRVHQDCLVGSINGGFREAMQFFDYNRAFLALACMGAADQSLDELTEHVKTRETFGQLLGKNQGVTFQMAEHMTRLESAKLLAYKVLWMKDTGIPHSKEAAMVKWYGINEAFRSLHTCVILSGWPAYSSDLPHERRMRDVMGLELGDGAPEIMKMVVAREAIGRFTLPYQRHNPEQA
jgi:cyclohexanecarboxyl-CoA dehydrogenase